MLRFLGTTLVYSHLPAYLSMEFRAEYRKLLVDMSMFWSTCSLVFYSLNFKLLSSVLYQKERRLPRDNHFRMLIE